MKHLIGIGAAALLVTAMPLAATADVAADVQAQCGSCHTMTHDYATAPLIERADRKAPPLDYAGNKFQRTWLASWLQNPTRIRPAGEFPSAHVKSGPDGDVIDENSLIKHPAVAAAEAEAMADYLMTLKPFDNLIEAETYEPGTIAKRMGQMNFGKFKGCDACHQDSAGVGGLSGPELYTAWQRLQPAFIASYMGNPVAWDPHTLMPKGDLNAASVKKIADYLKVIGENQP
ncbi:MAG: c-type cytochrome [Gammaproteobacteria bacterium]